jgi:hypothetical protein
VFDDLHSGKGGILVRITQVQVGTQPLPQYLFAVTLGKQFSVHFFQPLF